MLLFRPLRRGEILVLFLKAIDAKVHAASVEQKLSVRRESLLTKSVDVPVAEQHRRLGVELDKIERVSG